MTTGSRDNTEKFINNPSLEFVLFEMLKTPDKKKSFIGLYRNIPGSCGRSQYQKKIFILPVLYQKIVFWF